MKNYKKLECAGVFAIECASFIKNDPLFTEAVMAELKYNIMNVLFCLITGRKLLKDNIEKIKLIYFRIPHNKTTDLTRLSFVLEDFISLLISVMDKEVIYK